jgi:hypothetical protein
MNPILFTHGDVLLLSTKVPASASLVETNGVAILAHGETTGHSHHIIGPQVAMFRDDGAGSGGLTYLKVSTPTQLAHGTIDVPGSADHDTLTLPARDYESRRQVEWTDEMEPRRVAD